MYKAIFENTGTAMVIIEEDMSISLINDEFSKLSGFTRKDIEGKKSWTEFFGKDDLYKIKNYRQLRRINPDTAPGNYESCFIDKEGKIIDVLITFNMIPETAKSIASLVDITERKQTEELYRTMANSLQIGVYVVQNRMIVFANPHIPRYSGYSMEELLGSDILSYVHPEDREMVREKSIRMIKGESPTPYEYRIIDRNGNIKWLMETVSPIYYEREKAILGNTMDITEVKETREKLEQLKRLESTILTSVPHALFGLSDSRIIFVNAAVESVFGWKPDELIGKSIRILYRNDKEFEEIDKTINTELENRSVDIREPLFPNRRKDGKEIFCRVTAAGLGDSLDGKSIVMTFEDITEHKQAVEALRASEERYRSVIDNIAIGVSLISPDMKILSLNNQMRKWYPHVDVSTQPICYRTFNDPPREDICSYCPTFMTLRDGKVYESITETPVSGEIRNYRIISSPIKDKAGTVTAAIEMVDDITEDLEIQERLSISEKLYRTIFETTGAATVIIDEDMTILMTNGEFEKLSGYTKQEVDGKKRWTEFVEKYDLERMKEYHKLRRIDPNASPRNYEFTFLDSYGDKKEILSTVSMIPGTKKSVASFLDITDLKRLYKEIRKSEVKYRLLAENISDVIWTTDMNLTFTYISPSVGKLRGYSSDEAMKQTIREILTPDSYEAAMSAFRQGMAIEQTKQGDLEGPIALELEMIRKDGSTIRTEVKITFLRDSDGRLEEILGVTRDITQRKQTEKELELKSRHLEETNTALKVLLKHRETDKEELQENVLSNVRELIIPYIEKVKTCSHKSDQENYLDILKTNLNNIISPFLRNLRLDHCNLTPKEIQIANLIKEGKTTKEIADLLYLSLRTINFHRENIRKKLGLTNRKTNLQSHLSSLL
ncbi:MAG: PAS domain S-box protein [Deltaproteobacteria bacterium]|nr:PAS domain S-box protein [Deltaproteobacteria bacterium]